MDDDADDVWQCRIPILVPADWLGGDSFTSPPTDVLKGGQNALQSS